MAVTHYPNVLAPVEQDDHPHDRTYAQARDNSRKDENRPRSTVPSPPTIPAPTFQKNSYAASGRQSVLTPHDSAHTLSPDQAYLYENAGRPYQAPSMSSSASNSFAMTPISSNEMEKSSLSTKDSSDRRHTGSRKSSSNRDPEKGHARHHARTSSSPRRSSRHHHASHRHHQHRRRASVDPTLTTHHLRYSAEYDADHEQHRLQEAHAGRILFFLAFPCVALSFLNALWTVIALLVTASTQPVRLCARGRPTFGKQLGGLVGPALNLQLRCIDSVPVTHDDDDDDGCDTKGPYRPGTLVAVQMLSPILAFGLAVAAWVVAVFWLASAMIGDPVGLDRSRDDGRDTVLVLRGWWERWLVRSVREA